MASQLVHVSQCYTVKQNLDTLHADTSVQITLRSIETEQRHAFLFYDQIINLLRNIIVKNSVDSKYMYILV